MPNELTREYAKALYEFAVAVGRGPDTPYAIRLFEKLTEIGDPFYTPFALTFLDANYRKLGLNDLELRTMKRATLLPNDQQILLSPGWLATCYQKTGDFKGARDVLAQILSLSPHEPYAISALAELSLLEGNSDQTEAYATELQQRAEPQYQILGRIFRAFALALRNRHDDAAKELSWVGQFLISSASIPPGTWDYRDVQPVVAKTGPNARAFGLLLDTLMGKISLQEFTPAWAEI